MNLWTVRCDKRVLRGFLNWTGQIYAFELTFIFSWYYNILKSYLMSIYVKRPCHVFVYLCFCFHIMQHLTGVIMPVQLCPWFLGTFYWIGVSLFCPIRPGHSQEFRKSSAQSNIKDWIKRGACKDIPKIKEGTWGTVFVCEEWKKQGCRGWVGWESVLSRDFSPVWTHLEVWAKTSAAQPGHQMRLGTIISGLR